MPTLMFHTAGAERALASAGAYERSEVLAVSERKRVCLQLAYDAAGASGYPVVVPFVSFEETAPAVDADAWFAIGAPDATPTATSLTGAVPSGADYTLAPGAALVTASPLAIKPMAAASGATNELRNAVSVDLSVVPGARWFHFAVAEVGATGTPGSLLATATVG